MSTHTENIRISYQSLFYKTGDQKQARLTLEEAHEITSTGTYTRARVPTESLTATESLTRLGVATIEVIKPSRLESHQRRFDSMLESFPEYYRHPDDPTKNSVGDPIIYALGGFAALGNPGAFHNKFVRRLRVKARMKVEGLFKEIARGRSNPSEQRLEMIYDRPMFRRAGQAAVAEAWHRDVMKPEDILPEDEVFGGWVNIDSTDQYFSYIPGSHLGITQYNIESGFDTLAKAEGRRALNEDTSLTTKEIATIAAAAVVEAGKHKERFRVPPGHMIIFPQYILHEVVAAPVKHDMRRLFTGWRLTTADTPLKDYSDIMLYQRPVGLPGGMIPPVYSANHQSCYLGFPTVRPIDKKDRGKKWRETLYKKLKVLYPDINTDSPQEAINDYISRDHDMTMTLTLKEGERVALGTFRSNPGNDSSTTTLIKWSRETWKEAVTRKKSYKGGQGEYRVVDRYMLGLAEYGLPLYPSYPDKEKALYAPILLL